MADVALTVGEIVAIDTLRTEVVAGASGLGRRVVWAHSCELEEPWEWLGPDELLLTVGFCVPRDPAAQARFVRRLSDAGVAGASIGVRGGGLELSAEMRAEADRLGFPVLRTASEVPWSAITRHVAAASDSPRTADVLTLAKLYELTASVEHPQDLVAGVGSLLDAGIAVIDAASGRRLLESDPASPSPLRDAAASPPAPARRVRRHRLAGGHGLALELEIAEHPARPLSAMVLVHVKRLVEVEAERALLRLAAREAEWARALERLLGAGDSSGAAALLAGAPLRAVVLDRSAIPHLSRAAALRRLELIAGVFDGRGVVLVADERLGELRSLASDRGVAAGASSPFVEWSEARGAVAEAASAFGDAPRHGGWAEFAAVSIGILARSGREAERIVDDVLGELAGTERRMGELRETLFAFLRHDRRWAETSAELGIHRQTLAYRLRGIESATGRSLARSEDIAALWIAMQAWERDEHIRSRVRR